MLLDKIPLPEILTALLWMLHFPLAALTLGLGLLALLLRLYGRLEREPHRLRLAELLLTRLPGLRTNLLLLATLALNLYTIGHRLPALPLPPLFAFAVLTAVAVGLLLLHLASYLLRRQFDDPLTYLLGFLGVISFVGGYFLLLTGSTQLATPENWTLLERQPLLFFSWAGVARFAEFMLLTPALAGGVILLLGRGTLPACEPFRRFSERCAATVALPALALLPALLAFELNTRPLLAWSLPLFALSLLQILLGLAVALPLLQPLLGVSPARARWIAASAVLLFPLWVLQDVAAQAAVLTAYTLDTKPVYQEQPLTSRLAAVSGQPVARLQPKTEPVADLQRGERVYTSVCSACHEWDQRRVGPPYSKVIPKYKGRLDELKAFIRRPRKIDPGYPAMPNLGLSERDIDSVAHHLLSRAQ